MKKTILIITVFFTWIVNAQEIDNEMLMSENKLESSYLLIDDSLINFYIHGEKTITCDTKETKVSTRSRLFEFWVKVKHKSNVEINGKVYFNTYDMKRYLMDWKNEKAQLLAHITYNENGDILWSSYFDNKEYLNPFENDITLKSIYLQLGKPLKCRYYATDPINKATSK